MNLNVIEHPSSITHQITLKGLAEKFLFMNQNLKEDNVLLHIYLFAI